MTDESNLRPSPSSGEAGADSRAARRGIFASRAFAVGVAQAVLWTALGMVVMRIVPHFLKIFADFGTPLPDITIALIFFTRFLIRFWFVALLPVLCWPFLNCGIVSLLSLLPGRRILKRLWYFATWLALLVVVVLVVVALFLPLSIPFTHLSG